MGSCIYDRMIIGDTISYEILPDISCNCNLSLGSSYKSISLTRDEKTINKIEGEFHLNIVNPFNSLEVIKSHESTGKCWIFHLNTDGYLRGFLFHGGYRIKNQKKQRNFHGEFFLENRNIIKNRYGLLAAIVPNKPEVGGFNECELILVARLLANREGEIKLAMHKFLKGKACTDSLLNLYQQNKLS